MPVYRNTFRYASGRLDTLKRHPRETCSDVIRRLTETAIDTEPLSEETLGRIEEVVAVRDRRRDG